jgi:hypothetical protein
LDHADDHLRPASDHRLHDGGGHPGAERLGQHPVAGPNLIRAVQVQLDRAGAALVYQPGHVGLEHHRTAQPGGRDDGGFLAGYCLGADRRDPVAGQEVCDQARCQPAPGRRLLQEAADDRARVITPQVSEPGNLAGRPGPPGAVPSGVRQRAGRAAGMGIGRNGPGNAWRPRQQPDGFGLVEHDQRERLG